MINDLRYSNVTGKQTFYLEVSFKSLQQNHTS